MNEEAHHRDSKAYAPPRTLWHIASTEEDRCYTRTIMSQCTARTIHQTKEQYRKRNRSPHRHSNGRKGGE